MGNIQLGFKWCIVSGQMKEIKRKTRCFMQISTHLSETKKILKTMLPLGTSFDLLTRDLLFGKTEAFFFGIDGFVKDDIMFYILNRLQKTELPLQNIQNLSEWIQAQIPYIEVSENKNINETIQMVLSGMSALLIDGFDTAILLDTRTYPVRGVGEPDMEKVARGPRDGFVETIVLNTALVRRRIRDPRLTFEMFQIGSQSKTDIALGYIGNIVDQKLLAQIRNQLNAIDVHALNMGAKSLEELLIRKVWYNPLPQVRYTERPDVAAAHLLEGYILLFIDTTPEVIILPTTFFQFTQSAEDYYQNPAVGNYLRFVRFAAIFASLLLTPTWLMLTEAGISWSPFFTVHEKIAVPLVLQIILLELGLDLFRYVSSHAPSNLSGSLGLIGGLIIGDVAVQIGWITQEVMFYTAITALTTFAASALDFTYAIRIFRFVLIVCTGLFHIWGYILGIIYIVLTIITTPTIGGKKYTWPLYPFDKSAFLSLVFRQAVPKIQDKNYGQLQNRYNKHSNH